MLAGNSQILQYKKRKVIPSVNFNIFSFIIMRESKVFLTFFFLFKHLEVLHKCWGKIKRFLQAGESNVTF